MAAAPSFRGRRFMRPFWPDVARENRGGVGSIVPSGTWSLSGNDWATGRQVIQPPDKRYLLIEESIPLFARGITVDIPLDIVPIYQGF